jgi:hypothetical protein
MRLNCSSATLLLPFLSCGKMWLVMRARVEKRCGSRLTGCQRSTNFLYAAT